MKDFRNIRERQAPFCRKTEERLPKAPKTARKPAFYKERPEERLLKTSDRFCKNQGKHLERLRKIFRKTAKDANKDVGKGGQNGAFLPFLGCEFLAHRLTDHFLIRFSFFKYIVSVIFKIFFVFFG